MGFRSPPARKKAEVWRLRLRLIREVKKTMLRRLVATLFAGVCGFILLPAASAGEETKADEFFEKQVRRVLASYCIECHGPQKQKAGLRLDSREAIVKGGESGPAIVPGKPNESLLVTAV